MYRSIQNLDFINQNRRHCGPFEVTQLINSFLAVVAHPWDQLLDQDKLKKLTFDSSAYRECRFPEFPRLPVEGDQAKTENIYDLLRVLRNGMAHGNMELLDRKTLRKLRQLGPLPRVTEDEIAGIKIWNKPSENAKTNWCTALDIHDLRQMLMAMMRLCEKRHLWKDDVRECQDQRDAKRRLQRAR
jgi:hypothetical protein